MRIAHLSNSHIPSRRANSVQVMRMCQAFAKNGHTVTLYARPGDLPVADDYEHYGVEPCFEIVKRSCPRGVGRAGRGIVYALGTARRVRRGPRPDLIFGRSVACMAPTAFLGIPMVYEAHETPAGWMEHALCRWLLKRKSLVRFVVTSPGLRDEYERIFPGLIEEKVAIFSAGADLPSGNETLPSGTPWPRRPGCLQVGYVGHLYPGRGMEVLAPLAKRLPDVDFHIIGGNEGDITYWRRQTEGTANLHFHGYVAPKLGDAYRQAMDILLAPYQWRMLGPGKPRPDSAKWVSPLKLFEYMAARRPIVASDLPGTRIFLTDGVNALLVAPDAIGAWAKAVSRLGREPATRERLARRAYEDVASKHTWQLRAKGIIEAAVERAPHIGER